MNLQLTWMKHIGISLILVLISVSCRFFKGNPNQNSPISGKTTIAIDESLRPVFEAELSVFQGIYGYADLNVIYLPEQLAIHYLLSDSVQMAVACRPLRQEEITTLNQKKLFPKQLVVAKEGIALIVNPQRKDSLFSIRQVEELLNGNISNWKQLNGNLASEPVRLLFDNEKSGIIHYLADSICHGNFSVRQANAMNNSEEVIDYVAKHEGTIGFAGSSWLSNRNDSLHLTFHKKVRVAALSRSEPAAWQQAYQPFQAYLLEGIYPLTRNVYLINAEPRSGLATGFASFVASDKGQRIILKAGLVPAVAPTRVVNIRSKL